MNTQQAGGGRKMEGQRKKQARIDKVLGNLGIGSRSEIKKMAKQGRITLNGKVVKDSGTQCDPECDHIQVDGSDIVYREFIYLMLHKPAGVISATEDKFDKTVLDLISPQDQVFSPFPVGRLDKDTEGLLLLTNDGQLAHDLLSPRKHVPKIYEAKVVGALHPEHIELFKLGVTLDDGYVTMPAVLTILEQGDENQPSLISLTISEGKFHQVKRMFQAIGCEVVYLKRLAMGSLKLDETLPKGKYRELTEDELQQLRASNQ
ncbi:16S rRNA pseudouridine516 synthase [Paenibacillus turicensis]|uniref:Pseudouridine synthase n=2 Tax=Paenibacillus turicensis TaxID=160487 RepID=A0ABS4FTJ6_9BACL|nr:16S rRNA pseudouridine516 synthase [Paenibacillus turicensis]